MRTSWAAVAVCVAATGVPAAAAGQAPGVTEVVAVSGLTQVAGHAAVVEALVIVGASGDRAAAGHRVLNRLGAAPLDEEAGGASTTSAVQPRWRQFSDGNPRNDVVAQHYNPNGEPSTGGDYEAALLAGHDAWAAAEPSTFAFAYAGRTTRCPSLLWVHCSGALDGRNDAGWLPLDDLFGGVLGLAVTVYDATTGFIHESDFALTTAVDWFADESSAADDRFDAYRVMLHENGHVAGLGHLSDPGAIMFATLGSGAVPRDLTQSDVDAISALYPPGDTGGRGTRPARPARPRTPPAKGGDLDPHFARGGVADADAGRVSFDIGSDVATYPGGGVVVAGATSDFRRSDGDVALVRYSPQGALDESFAHGGRLSVDHGTPVDAASAVAVQAGGGIVVAGSPYVTMARILPGGALDPGFGAGGKVVTEVPGSASSMALYPDDSIVVGGSFVRESSSPQPPPGEPPPGEGPGPGGPTEFDLFVAAYDVDGRPDADFGEGGLATAGFSTVSPAGVALAPDGAIVLAGTDMSGPTSDVALARFDAAGRLDPGFGSGGRVVVDLGGHENAAAVAVQPDGSVVVAGQRFDDVEFTLDAFVARFDASGVLDPGFGAAGLATSGDAGFDGAADVALQPDGRIVAAGFSDWSPTVTRFDPSGVLDASFGDGGRVSGPSGGTALALAVDGSVVVTAGFAVVEGGGPDIAVNRFTADGVPDAHFGLGGAVTTGFHRVESGVSGVAADTQGRVAGVGWGGSGFAAMRFTPDGWIDPGFDRDGKVATAVDPGLDAAARAVAVTADSMILAVGDAGRGIALVRYRTDGSHDPSFGAGGVARSFPGDDATARAVAVRGDGRILVAGAVDGVPAVVAFSRDGTPDASFGHGGVTRVPLGGGVVHAIVLTDDGAVVAAGESEGRLLLARLRPDGTPDVAFGSAGVVRVDGLGPARGVVAPGDGRVVVVVDGMGDLVLARFRSDGSLDRRFGDGGVVSTDAGGDDRARAIARWRDGFVIAGSTATPSGGDVVVARYRRDGSLDRSFGRTGVVSSDLGGDERADALAVQPDGKVLVGGTRDGYGAPGGFVLRYEGRSHDDDDD